jgi:hypothetical protein
MAFFGFALPISFLREIEAASFAAIHLAGVRPLEHGLAFVTRPKFASFQFLKYSSIDHV